MSAIASAPAIGRIRAGEHVSWSRLAWVAPLTLLVAVAACYGIRSLVQMLLPNLSRMPMLGQPMVSLAAEGAIAAIVAFVLFALFVPRAIFWYRIVGGVALLLSWVPDIALGMGGTPMQMAMRYVGPLASLGLSGPGGGGPASVGPP